MGKEKNEEEEIVPVGEGLEEEQETLEGEEREPPKKKAAGADEEEEEGSEEEEEEERLGAGEEGEDDLSDKRKQERKSRRQRQKEARDRDKRELQFLSRRNEELERRFSEVEQRVGHSEITQIDARISDLNSKIKMADDVLGDAVEKGNGKAYREALEIRDKLVETRAQLNYYKGAAKQRSDAAPANINPRMLSHAQAWMRDHPWWKPGENADEDSRRVSRIDAALMNEGYDPTSGEYWDELTDRVQKALPHRFKDETLGEEEEEEEPGGRKKKNGKGKGKGPTFHTGGRERPLKKNEVYISPERKQAMVEAGVWDDPELRQKYLRSYAKYDQQARANRS